MFLASFTDRELETLILALRHWRHHRSHTETRRNDRVLTSQEVDALLGKLGCGALASPSPDDWPAGFFPR